MSKHTPGPWEAHPSNAERYSQYVAPKNMKSWPYDVVAYVPEAYGDKCTFPGAHMANARLIAAAPDLLEALKVAAQFMSIASDWNMDEAEINDEMRSTYDWLEMVNTAIAKATGAAA